MMITMPLKTKRPAGKSVGRFSSRRRVQRSNIALRHSSAGLAIPQNPERKAVKAVSGGGVDATSITPLAEGVVGWPRRRCRPI